MVQIPTPTLTLSWREAFLVDQSAIWPRTYITILTPLSLSLEPEPIGKDVSTMQATLDRLPQLLF